jgi:hypothetical protein
LSGSPRLPLNFFAPDINNPAEPAAENPLI